MAEDDKRKRLGRGLAALIGEAGSEAPAAATSAGAAPSGGAPARAPRRVPIELIKPNPRNPRQTFTESDLQELTDSIRERGIIQPIVVRVSPGVAGSAPQNYEIIAGERRWRAAQRAGLHDVPVAIVEASDRESLEYAIVENVQRADLNAIEEAQGYDALAEQFDYSQEDIARIVGKSRSHVANTLRLLKLSKSVQSYVRSGELTAGHARMLVGQPNAEEFARDIIKRGLSVRQVEELSRQNAESGSDGLHPALRPPKGPGGARSKDADTRALERRISDALGLKVTIDQSSGDRGVMHIAYRDFEQLDHVLEKLGVG